MKTENKLKYLVIMYLLLFLCAICISFNLTINGVQSAKEMQEPHLASINYESYHSGDGNNNTLTHKIINSTRNRITFICKSGLLFFVAATYSTIIFFIQISEAYYSDQDYYNFSKLSLLTQKIRLNI